MKQIEKRMYCDTYDFVGINNLEIEAVECFGKDWEAADDCEQIQALMLHVGVKNLMTKYHEDIKSNDDIEVCERVFNLTIDDLKDLKYKITQKLVEEGIIPDCTDTENEAEVNTENAIEETFKEFVAFDYD